MFTIVDFNNFWSPSGGGVRRYHLQKMAFYERQNEVRSVFVMPSASTYTETRSEGLIIEHVEAFRFPGNWEYRFMWKSKQIRPILEKYKPDVIEVGSPYILPSVVRRIAKKVVPNAALFSFWHADFPVTYVGRPIAKKFGAGVGVFSRKIAFWYAKQEFKGFDCVQASSKEAMARLKKNGLPDPRWIPLGCDIETFSPSRRDEAFVLFKDLAKKPATQYGAEANYLLIQDAYDRAKYQEVQDLVYAFAESGSGNGYYLAKSFIILGDSFADQDEFAQAKATFESIRDGYTNTGDDVLESVKMRLEKLEELSKN